MGTPDPRPRAARRPLPPPLRLLAIFLMVAQLVPAAVAHADPVPGPPTHTDHLGGPDDRGCQPFHDAIHCLVCRLMSTQPLGSDGAVSTPAAQPWLPLELPSDDRLAPAVADRDAPNARAPPIS
ncbi:MAG: hypothetical protein P8177_01000 [Gemmatimonadota bacterium]|jgi:hypothetical protein